MIKQFIKNVFKIFGLSLHRYKKSNVHTNEENFIPFGIDKELDAENSLYYEGIKKSKNIQTDNFSKKLSIILCNK